MARKVMTRNIAYDDKKRLYYVNMDYGKNTDGKRVKTAKTFKNLKEAKNALKIFEADKARQRLVMPSAETLATYSRYWLTYERADCRETTIYTYSTMLSKHIIPYFGDKPLQKIGKEDIYRFFAHLKTEKQLGVNSVRKHYNILRSIFASAEQAEKLYVSPMKTIPAPKPEPFESRVYNPGQIVELLRAAAGSRIEIAVQLAVYLGLRRGEICALQWSSVDLERRTADIVLNRTMAGGQVLEGPVKSETSERRLKIPDGLMPALISARARQEHGGGYVFCYCNGRPYRPNYLSKLFSRLLEQHGLQHIRFHDLRHSHGSIAILGAPLYDVSKSLGHSRQEVTQRIYLKDIIDIKSAAVDSVDDALKTAMADASDGCFTRMRKSS